MLSTKELVYRVMRHPYYFIAFGFGSGLSPIVPGTVGTLAAMCVYYPLSFLPWGIYLLVLLFSLFFGIFVCDKVTQALGVQDYRGIVWDEFVGYWITMFLAPPGIVWMGLGFVLFRAFDILKPPPIGWIDRQVSGGLGIMLDDVLAGVFSWACLQLIVTILG